MNVAREGQKNSYSGALSTSTSKTHECSIKLAQRGKCRDRDLKALIRFDILANELNGELLQPNTNGFLKALI